VVLVVLKADWPKVAIKWTRFWRVLSPMDCGRTVVYDAFVFALIDSGLLPSSGSQPHSHSISDYVPCSAPTPFMLWGPPTFAFHAPRHDFHRSLPPNLTFHECRPSPRTSTAHNLNHPQSAPPRSPQTRAHFPPFSLILILSVRSMHVTVIE